MWNSIQQGAERTLFDIWEKAGQAADCNVSHLIFASTKPACAISMKLWDSSIVEVTKILDFHIS